jgi:hypothetical protein
MLDEGYPELTHDTLISHLDFFSQIIRNILRYLVQTSAYDSATLLEMLWKLVVKTLDVALAKYEAYLTSLSESMKVKIRRVR